MSPTAHDHLLALLNAVRDDLFAGQIPRSRYGQPVRLQAHGDGVGGSLAITTALAALSAHHRAKLLKLAKTARAALVGPALAERLPELELTLERMFGRQAFCSFDLLYNGMSLLQAAQASRHDTKLSKAAIERAKQRLALIERSVDSRASGPVWFGTVGFRTCLHQTVRPTALAGDRLGLVAAGLAMAMPQQGQMPDSIAIQARINLPAGAAMVRAARELADHVHARLSTEVRRSQQVLEDAARLMRFFDDLDQWLAAGDIVPAPLQEPDDVENAGPAIDLGPDGTIAMHGHPLPAPKALVDEAGFAHRLLAEPCRIPSCGDEPCFLRLICRDFGWPFHRAQIRQGPLIYMQASRSLGETGLTEQAITKLIERIQIRSAILGCHQLPEPLPPSFPSMFTVTLTLDNDLQTNHQVSAPDEVSAIAQAIVSMERAAGERSEPMLSAPLQHVSLFQNAVLDDPLLLAEAQARGAIWRAPIKQRRRPGPA